MKRLRLWCLALVLAYVCLPPLALNVFFARQGDELGRTALCCSPLICTEFKSPDFGPMGNVIALIIMGAVVVVVIILACWPGPPDKPSTP
jgi:hypothetical protein